MIEPITTSLQRGYICAVFFFESIKVCSYQKYRTGSNDTLSSQHSYKANKQPSHFTLASASCINFRCERSSMQTWHSYFHVLAETGFLPKLLIQLHVYVHRVLTREASLFTKSLMNKCSEECTETLFLVKVWVAILSAVNGTQDKRGNIVKFAQLVKLPRSALGQVGNPLDSTAFPLRWKSWILNGVVTPLTKTFAHSTKSSNCSQISKRTLLKLPYASQLQRKLYRACVTFFCKSTTGNLMHKKDNQYHHQLVYIRTIK